MLDLAHLMPVPVNASCLTVTLLALHIIVISSRSCSCCMPVQIVAETDELVAVHKPASIPVHVSGQYRKNTVMALLQVDRPDLGRLFPVHRLDKPVSGLLLIAKTAAAANDVRTQIMVRSCLSMHLTYCCDSMVCIKRQIRAVSAFLATLLASLY